MTYRSINNKAIGGNAFGISLSGLHTREPISNNWALHSRDSLNFLAYVGITQAKVITGITIRLQEWVNYPGNSTYSYWRDIGSGAAVSLTTTTCADGDVTSGSDNINIGTHGYSSGDLVNYNSSAGNEITGLTDAASYFVAKIDNDNFKLATSYENAVAGTPVVINLTQPSGGDTHYFTKVSDCKIQLNVENATDEAYLPILPKVRLVADMGANDILVVDSVMATERSEK